jgi:hypothetical protein
LDGDAPACWYLSKPATLSLSIFFACHGAP